MAATDYELVLMLDPQTADEQRARVADDARSKIKAAGNLKQEADWGLRKMAYEIRQRTEAEYRLYRFDGGKDLLDDLDHSLKIADGVLRFRVFKVDADSPVIEPPDTEQIMRRDDDDRGGRREGGRGPRRSRPSDAQRPSPPEQPEQPEQPSAEEPQGEGAPSVAEPGGEGEPT